MREITSSQEPQPIAPLQGESDPDFKGRVTVLALDYMKRHKENGKLQFLNSILVSALGVHKTFADCTNEDFRAIEAKLCEVGSYA